MKHIVIIGNGIAGITAARHIRKLSDFKISVISAESPYFFSRTALMYVYMGHMKFEQTQPYPNDFWAQNRIELIQDYVFKITTTDKQVHLNSGRSIIYDQLILATGSISNKFGWKGQDLNGVQGLVNKQDLELLEINAPNNQQCKRAVIIGGGLIGVEFAEMLASRNIPVTFLIRESGFWSGVLPQQDAQMISQHIRSHHIDLREQEELVEIMPDTSGNVKAVRTNKGNVIDCNMVGLCAGVRPNIAFLRDSGIDLDRGILVNNYLQTNIPDVYAIGDCAQQIEPIGQRKAIEAVWYTGRMMGETVAQTICGNAMPWRPGHWFNSAKFFDIEYQTYGWVWSTPQPGNQHFNWQHADGMRAMTIEYETTTRKLIGINSFGIRLKHELFDLWLNQQQTIDHVIQHLDQACFNPEFFDRPFQQIKQQFSQNNLSISN